MSIKNILESAEAFLFICLIFALVLSAFIFFFVFCIDWVDWFFGMNLEGPPAGICLFTKLAGAIGIICLMAHYPRYRRQSILLVFFYYGFLCLDALVTLKNSQGSRDYPLMMLVLFFISVLLFVVHGTLSLTGGPVTEESP